jgi:hypothetical protein
MSWTYGLHPEDPWVEQGVLLEVHGALPGHFWTKFIKQKLPGATSFLGDAWPGT